MKKTNTDHPVSLALAADLAPYNRRAFLKGSMMAFVAASSVLTLGCSSEAPHDLNLTTLTVAQQAVFVRLTQVLLPTRGTVFQPADKVPVLANIDALIETLEPKIRKDLGGAILLFEYGALVLGGHFSRFSKLNDADAVAYIDQWQASNSIQRGIVATLKRMVYASYWREESTWLAVDYDGPVSERWGLASLGNAPLPVDA